ncbi:LytR family transcriptional regulator [Ligilactobacillus salitolerans]|uniref:LytR family transcriptional regulator n=1 Tax=Ligilactobacillus salitolerans TaxID=1808352 RepID=A0A401IVX9_9LACO|nr:LCP family protein [Ligilactobacillus salitolerans]GBG95668.1 LytR family transcriptional regulator [Ligilactobacillus salitolerans]
MDNKDNQGSEYSNNHLRRSDHGSPHQIKKNHAWRKWICGILLAISLVVIYGGTAYAYNMLHSAKNTLTNTYTKSNVKKLRNVSDIIKKKKPFSLLILGTDTGDLGRSDKGRTDTIILATVNPQKGKVTLTSIPRDTEVKIAGSDNSYDKVNTAYTIGGVSTAIKTVQNTLHVPVDYYLLVNMGGLRKIVDALGGVTVTPTLTFKYSDADVTKGKTVTLNGKQALAYSRMRYDDPQGDYGRQKRQKQVIESIINKALSVATISRFEQLLKSIQSNMQTDLSYNDMMTIETNYKKAGKSVDSYVLQGQDAMLDGLSYQVATPSEKKKASTRIRAQLNLAPSNEDFSNVVESDGSTGTSSGSSYGTGTGSYSNTQGTSQYGADQGYSQTNGQTYGGTNGSYGY